jgi:DNA repair exonuclease SbcCD ATPase subunit
MSHTIIFSIIAAVISIGGVFIAIGVFKGKINQNAEANKVQDEQMKALASKDELTAAIKRSDEMLTIMTKRAEEDRLKGQSQWREFHEIISKHSERIGVLENQQTILMKALDEIKGDLKSGFRQLQDELKELRNLR